MLSFIVVISEMACCICGFKRTLGFFICRQQWRYK